MNRSKDKFDWEKEWDGMPEFVQDSKESIASVVIHFETEEDMDAFSKLIGRKITKKTKGVFFPVKEKEATPVYVDEE